MRKICATQSVKASMLANHKCFKATRGLNQFSKLNFLNSKLDLRSLLATTQVLFVISVYLAQLSGSTLRRLAKLRIPYSPYTMGNLSYSSALETASYKWPTLHLFLRTLRI